MDKIKSSSLLNCFICSQPFTSRHAINKGGTSKVPLALDCGHSVCESCVTRLVNKPGDSLTCQLCNQVTTASESYNPAKPSLEFPLNTLILGQLTLKSQSGWDDNKIAFTAPSSKLQYSPRTVTCHECAERRAEFNCVQCQVPYCGLCFNRVHQSAKAFKDHIKTDLVSTDAANIEVKCPVHRDQNLQFWCDKCNVAVCSSCMISIHNGHTISLLTDKNLNCFKALISAHVNVSNVQARLKATKKKAFGSLSKYESSECKGAEKEIREHFARLHGLLLAKENKLLNKLYSPYRGSANNLKNMIQQIDASIEDLEQTLLVSTCLIKNDVKYLNCASYPDVLDRLRVRETVPCFLIVQSELKDTSRFTYNAEIFDVIENHGEIDVSNIEPLYKLVVEDDLPADYYVEPIKSLSVDSLRVSSGSLAILNSQSTDSLSPATSLLSLNSVTCGEQQGPGPSNGAQSAESSTECGNRNFDELVEGCKVRVILTHAASPSDFYVRRTGSEKKLIEINQIFSTLNLKTPPESKIKPGEFFMAQFSQDLKWYRSVVLEVDQHLITVFYIDFGNTESVKRESLKVMPDQLKKHDGMALHCCLHECKPSMRGEWAPQSISTMLKILESGDLYLTIKQRTRDILCVDLLRQDQSDVVNLKEALVFLGFAKSTDPKAPPLKVETINNQRQLNQSKVLPNGKMFEVALTHFVSPSEFYVRDIKSIDMRKLTDGLHGMYARKSERSIIYHPKIGMIIAAMNANNNEWRRAKIIDVPDIKKVKVKYLDFGDSEVISYKRIRYLAHKFFKISQQCIHCGLVDIKPVEGNSWSGLAVEKFAALLEDHPSVGYKSRLRLAIHGLSDDFYQIVLYKDLTDKTLCVNTALVRENVALSTGPNSTIYETPIVAREDTSSPLASKSVMSSNASIGATPVGSSLLPSLMDSVQSDVLKYVETQAQSVHKSTPNLYNREPSRSQFVGSTASLILPMPDKGKEKESGSSRSSIDEWFETTPCFKPFPHQKISINLQSKGGQDSKAYKGSLPQPKPLTPKSKDLSYTIDDVSSKPAQPSENIKIPVRIIKVVNPSEFYITPESLVVKLKNLKNEMQKFYGKNGDGLKLKEVGENSVCVVLRETEKDYCRAVITHCLQTTVKARLPDFGEVVEVGKDSIFSLDDKFKVLRDGATRCHLGGLKQPLDDKWPMTSTAEMTEFAEKYEGKIYITKLGKEMTNSLPVEVLLKEEVAASALEPTKVTWTSLNNNLRMRGLALSDGTIDWDVEDFKFQTVQQQKARLQVEVFKGIPIQYTGVANPNQTEYLDDIATTDSIFGSVVNMHDVDNLDISVSKLSLCSQATDSSSSNAVADGLSSGDDQSNPKSKIVHPQTPLTLPPPSMPKSWPPAVPFSKMEFIANPTNVNFKASIFLQDFQKSISTLRRIGDILDSTCRMTLPSPHDMYWSVDQTCIAKFHLDQKWYRGVIRSVKDNSNYMVELVDYGNIEECSVSDLRKIPLATDIPIQGQFCKLKKVKPNTIDGQWTIPVLDRIHALVVEKHCLVKLSYDHYEQCFYIENVKLPDGSEMLGYLVKEGLACFDDIQSVINPSIMSADAVLISDALSSQSCVQSDVKLDPEECQVLSQTNLQDFTNPESQTIQKKSWVEECEEMEAVESRKQESELDEEMRRQEEAERLYRAEELRRQEETVRFYQQEELRLQQQASMYQADPLTSDSESLYNAGQRDDPTDLYDMNPSCLPEDDDLEGQEFSYLYLDIPENLERFEVEVGALLKGDTVVFNITSSDDLKINESRERFKELNEELQTECPLQPPVNFPRPNDVCCAQYSLDDLWYRAQILQVVDEENVIVRYVDYGNCEKIPLSRVREMKEIWTMVEVQSFEAKLHNIVEADLGNNWKVVQYELREALFDKKLTAIVFNRDPMLSVELYEGDKLAYQNLINAGLLHFIEDK